MFDFGFVIMTTELPRRLGRSVPKFTYSPSYQAKMLGNLGVAMHCVTTLLQLKSKSLGGKITNSFGCVGAARCCDANVGWWSEYFPNFFSGEGDWAHQKVHIVLVGLVVAWGVVTAGGGRGRGWVVWGKKSKKNEMRRRRFA